ncbi:MAG: autorepressor SdpR family transcription factor [Peptoniphilaceae bacterium]
MSLGKTFKALSDENRRKILNMLKSGPLSAGEIAEKFNMTNATVSYHLSILKDSGLIVSNRDKNFIYYELNASVFEELINFVMDFKEE